VDQADARGRPPHGQQDCQDLANAQCKLNTWIRLIIAGIIIWVLGKSQRHRQSSVAAVSVAAVAMYNLERNNAV
jgi:hypothetical protein